MFQTAEKNIPYSWRPSPDLRRWKRRSEESQDRPKWELLVALDANNVNIGALQSANERSTLRVLMYRSQN
jgi:hypothetical protein